MSALRASRKHGRFTPLNRAAERQPRAVDSGDDRYAGATVANMDFRQRLAAARVARLATADGSGVPHLVPIVFALDGDAIHTCVDDKPKTTRRLRRLADIAENPRVSVLVDHYDDDWSQLWWVRIDGIASVHGADSDAGTRGLDALAHKYAQYRAQRPSGPVITIDRLSWRSWSA